MITPENLQTIKFKLRKKLWKTYQTRIITSERLEWNESFYQKINVYYSIVIVIFSIFDILGHNINLWKIGIIEPGKTGLSLILLVSSIISAIFAMFISSKGYKERSLNMKMHYIDLKDLFYELTFLNKDDSEIEIKEIEKIQCTYSKLLKTVENHSKYDYIKFRMENNSKNGNINECCTNAISNDFVYDTPSGLEKFQYYLNKIWNKIIIFSLITAPYINIFILKTLGVIVVKR